MDKAHILKIIAGVVIGAAAGGAYGYLLKCTGGT